MSRVSINDLVLRCYGYKKDSAWVGVCIDLDIVVQSPNLCQLKKKMGEVVSSYIETVLDTEDKESIPVLLTRKAPLSHCLIYQLIKMVSNAWSLSKRFSAFAEILPFHLARSC
ncbi:MAG: hypothetical protein U9P37_07610 [Pseudomonadota bacterium]|nr:hypothetical protein [Pseudomonadota bacterium]